MQTTIIIDDLDRDQTPSLPWTANVTDENGDTLADPGYGKSRRAALLDLLGKINREFPNFADIT